MVLKAVNFNCYRLIRRTLGMGIFGTTQFKTVLNYAPTCTIGVQVIPFIISFRNIVDSHVIIFNIHILFDHFQHYVRSKMDQLGLSWSTDKK